MKLALLGTDDRIDLVAAAAERAGHRIVATSDLPPQGRAWGPAVHWESLLDSAACDGILVGSAGWSAARADATRALVQAGRPLLLSHPAELSMLWAWEVEMIRQDVGGRVMPLLPDRLHPFVTRLRSLLEAALAGGGSRGAVESVVLERRMIDRQRDTVLTWLARDADLVRVVVGEPTRIAALGVAPDAEPTAWNSLTVGLTGPASVPVRWQVAGGSRPGLDLTVHCERTTVTVSIPDDWSQPWRWIEPDHPAEEAGFDRAATMVDLFAGRARDRDEGDVPPALWSDAARAIELAEAVPRSLAKGRGVDLHQEEFSEMGTFRGTMASAGCGLLLAALGLLVVATLVGGIAHEFGWDVGGRIVAAWPLVVLVALGGFLLLQLLPLLMGGSREHE
jgi:predicted dehydrogenase